MEPEGEQRLPQPWDWEPERLTKEQALKRYLVPLYEIITEGEDPTQHEKQILETMHTKYPSEPS